MDNSKGKSDKKPNAFAQLFSSERVLGAAVLVGLVALTLLFPRIFADHQDELLNILVAFLIQFLGWHTYVKISAGELLIMDDPEKPLIGTLDKLWRSRKFVTTVIGIVLEGLVILLRIPPEMETQLMVLILGVVTYFNGAVAVEDAKFNHLFRGSEPAKRAI